MEFENIIYGVDEGVATITMNQPDRRNALSMEMAEEMREAVRFTAARGEAGVLVLTGSGKAFCGGGDVKSMAEGATLPVFETRERILAYYRTALSIRELEIPTIASLNGHAIGAGLTLALACDLRLAAEKAKMGSTFIQIGLPPGMGTTYFLPRAVGLARACELIFTAKVIDAREAERIGLINYAVHAEELEEKTRELARAVARGPAVAIRMAKRALHQGMENDLESVLEFEALAQSACAQTEDVREGIEAFIQKREPHFKGR
jgi:2-(1,2-epoxy-1,2-dihydrophenyl)acetyl-CoA isomerase